MICPHCGKNIHDKSRQMYFAKRHIDSGRAKIRTSVEQIGVCITEGCENRVKGKRWYCNKCRKARREMVINKQESAV